MGNMVFNSKQEIIKNVEENSSFRFKEEKNNTIVFNNKRGDSRIIEYEITDDDKIKVNKDDKRIKPLSLSKL